MNFEELFVGAVDLDDTTVGFHEAFAYYNRVQYGAIYTLADIKNFHLDELLKCSHAEVMRRVHAFSHSDFHHMIEPKEDAVEVLTWLRPLLKGLHVITARDEVVRVPTINLTEKYFPGMFDGYHFLHHDNQNVLGEKGEVCARLGASFIFEDGLHNALHPSMTGTQVYLFDKPWNQTADLPKYVTRVSGWRHAGDEVSKLLTR